MEFYILIGGLALLFYIISLSRRVHHLEQIVKGEIAQQSTQVDYLSQTKIAEGLATSVSASPSQPEIGHDQTGPNAVDRFVEWAKDEWLLKLGALLLLIGFGWLTSYAFLNNWIGPMGRINLGLIAGALFIILGWWRIKNYINQGGVFLVLGSSTILLTIFAAREIYGFFNPLFALVVMFLSTAFVALASVKYNNRALALSSLILAGVAPLLTNSPNPDFVGLFFYLFVVVLGAIWIVVLTGRRELTTAALILVTFYSLPHLLFFSSAVDKGALLLFAYAFAVVFFFTNTMGILKLKDKNISPDLLTAAGNGIFLLSWILVAATEEWKSLIISAWAIVFIVGAFLIFKATRRKEPFYAYAGVGIAMIAAATSVELSGASLAIAFIIESAVISLVTFLVLKDIKIAERMNLLLICPVVLSFASIASSAWSTGVFHRDFFMLLILSFTLLGLGLMYKENVKEVEDPEPRQLNTILLTAGSIYAYILLWLSLHAGLQNDNQAVMISLVIYTVIGLITYFYGLTNEKKSLRLYGSLLIGFVTGRLFLVDVWEMELAGRIITFFLIGALLMSTAFLGKKKSVSSLTNNGQ